MTKDDSVNDEVTSAGMARWHPRVESQLGGGRTHGGDTGELDMRIDDLDFVDLEARYRVEGTLGRGGMGAVLLATDTRLDRRVAIKRILGEAAGNRMAVQRFLIEAKAIAALSHPNIIQVHDYGRAKDGPYLIMEYADGGSLLDRCRSAALPLDEAIELACQLCDGLAHAHDRGIIHRDIKPANVLLTREGLAKLTDFGLAKLKYRDDGQTIRGLVLGTPDFMSPEQRRDAAQVDARSDLWSLAATIYQMVTGRSPKVIRLHELPPSLQPVMARALEDVQEARYQSAREFREALKTGLRADGPVAAAAAVNEGRCPACGVQNDAQRRFCRGCGGSLDAPCLGCGASMPMWEEICGVCGAKQTPLVGERRRAIAALQAAAEGWLGDFEFDRAQAIALELRDESHPRLRPLADWATSFLDRIESSRSVQTRQAFESLVASRQSEADHDYLAAQYALAGIPVSLSGTVLPGEIESVAARRERLRALEAQVRRLDLLVQQRLAAADLDGLLPEVERLIALQPRRQDLEATRDQLLDRARQVTAARDAALRAAEASLAAHDYSGAIETIAGLDDAALTSEVVELRKRADGLWMYVRALSGSIADAVAANDLEGLLETVEQYLELQPSDEEMIGLRQSLLKREERIAGSLETAHQLLAVCRFDDAIESLEAVPAARRSAPVLECLTFARHLATLRRTAMSTLAHAREGGYENAVKASVEYHWALFRARIAEASDAEFSELLRSRKSLAAAEKKRLRTIVRRRQAAAGLAVGLLLASVLWQRSMAARSAAVADALAQRRWEAALAIDPDNISGLLGRAAAHLAAVPAKATDALADLDRAVRLGEETRHTQRATRLERARAKEQRRSYELDWVLQDLAELERRGAPASFVAEARAAAWVGRAREACVDGDAMQIQHALHAATAAGAALQTVLNVWQHYARTCIAALDATSLAVACAEARKVGLPREQEVDWWIAYGNVAAARPRPDVAAVQAAIGSAGAAGATTAQVAPLLARCVMAEAVALIGYGHAEAAAAKATEATLLDASLVVTELSKHSAAELREAVLAGYRGPLHQALARGDVETALQIAAAASTLDAAAAEWVGAAFSANRGRLRPVRSSALAGLPSSMVAALPAAALHVLPPEAILALPPLNDSSGGRLKLLPSGTFAMRDAARDDAANPHMVTISKPFFIGVHEVTNAEWRRVMPRSSRTRGGDDTLPAVEVSWDDAVAFCRALSAMPEERQAGREYRLPTEAEWEYACRAGTTTRYACGDDASRLDDHGWFEKNAGDQVRSVGAKAPNQWGLHDTHGNVWEWCSDWHGEFGESAVMDPRGPSTGTARINRGGSALSPARFCQSSWRRWDDPSRRLSSLGFRVALSPPGVSPPEAAAGE